MRQAVSSPTPLKKVRRNKALSRTIWFLVILVALFIGIGLLSHIPRMVISDVSISGTQVLDVDEVRTKTLAYLDSNVALFYARGNTLIFSKKKITEFIKREFPRVYEVNDINLVGQKLNIALEERRAAFTWCGNESPVYETRFEKSECFFLDQTGFIFDTSPFFTPGVYLQFYGGIDPNSSPIGQTLGTKNRMTDFNELVKSFETHGLSTHAVVIGLDGQNKFLLNNFTTTGDFTTILFNEDADLIDVLNKINFALKEEAFIEEFKDRSASLEYIDTRFSNRVFYKFKEI